MKTLRMFFVTAVIGVLCFSLPAHADTRIDARITVGGCRPDNLEVFVWPDRGIDAVYYPGDPIRIFFEVTRDSYLMIYNIDTRGRMHVLLPFDPWQDNFVQAGRVYEIPGDWDDFSLTVEGPGGAEYIQAIASPRPFDLPDWPIYINSPGRYPATCPDPVFRDFRAGYDRIGYIEKISRHISRRLWDRCATDLARFFVERRRPLPPRHVYYDPWPDVFYGEIYISWPLGARIFVDNVFYGVAPCWIRGVRYGRHRITCYDGRRLVHEKQIRFRHKRSYRQDHPDYRLSQNHGPKPYRSVPGSEVVRPDTKRGRTDQRTPRGRKNPVPVNKDRRKVPEKEFSRRIGRATGVDREEVRVSVSRTNRRESGLGKLISSVGKTVAGELKRAGQATGKAAKSELKAGKAGAGKTPRRNKKRR